MLQVADTDIGIFFQKPDGTFNFHNQEFYGAWVQAEGPATVESLPDALEGLVRYYRRVSGEHPDWDESTVHAEAVRRLSHGAI